MSEVTFKDIENKVRELAEAKPEFVYDRGNSDTCLYNPNSEQPGCLFGQALIALGKEVREELEGEGIDTVLNALDIDYTVDQRRWACRVQTNQDSYDTWEEAVKRADAAYPLHVAA